MRIYLNCLSSKLLEKMLSAACPRGMDQGFSTEMAKVLQVNIPQPLSLICVYQPLLTWLTVGWEEKEVVSVGLWLTCDRS